MLLAMMARQIRDRFARASPWRAHGMMRPIYDVCALLIALAAVVTPGMAAGVKYAAMSVDANTGNVLHAEAADAPRYPASLTKVMTLYIVFEEMQLGRLRADTQIRISPAAASVCGASSSRACSRSSRDRW